MAKLLKLRRGTTSQHSSFTGAEGEVTVDTDKETLVVHDGSTAGGHPVAAEDMANVSSASIAGRLGTDSIATSKIAAGALPTDVTIASANIVNGTIATDDIGGNQITTGKIANDAVTNAKIADDAVDTAQILNNAVTNSKLQTDAVTGAKIADDSINSEHYVDGSIDRTHLSADIIDGSKIADDVINSEHYAAGSIDNEHLANDCVNGNKIANDSINSEHYVADSIDSEHYAPNSVDDDALSHALTTSSGTYGSATQIPALTINAQGRITAASVNTVNTTTNLGISRNSTQVTVTSSTGNDATIGEASSSQAGVMTTTHHDKLDGIASGATNNGSGLVTGRLDLSGGTLTGTVISRAIRPSANNTYDLGTSTYRYRNVYTNDLCLSNQGSSNDVDGTWGDWTIQEGESDLFLKNNRSGKKYKFNLTEVS